jgi:RNA polymerase sigma-70 factor (ECF subfamily)
MLLNRTRHGHDSPFETHVDGVARRGEAHDGDAALLERIAAGDEDAFATLYRTYQKRLFSYLFRLVGDAARCEELVDDVLFDAWRGAARFQGQSRVSTWLFGIAHHKAVNVLRQRRIHLDEEPALDLPEPAESVDEALARSDLAERLRECLALLSPAHREVVELTLTEGFSVEEIAGIVGCPPGTVKTRMFHARRALRAILAGRGLSPDAT